MIMKFDWFLEITFPCPYVVGSVDTSVRRFIRNITKAAVKDQMSMRKAKQHDLPWISAFIPSGNQDKLFMLIGETAHLDLDEFTSTISSKSIIVKKADEKAVAFIQKAANAINKDKIHINLSRRFRNAPNRSFIPRPD